MLPLIMTSLSQGSGGSNKLQARTQRLYVVYGRETTRVAASTQKLFVVYGRETSRIAARTQKLFVVLDDPPNIGAGFRYWRVLILDNTSSNFYGIAEIEMRESLGGADVLTGGVSTVSNNNGGDGIDAWVDNNTATYTRINEPSAEGWMQYDFGAANDKNIVEIVITAPAANGEYAPIEFLLQGSPDGQQWYTRLNVSGEAAWADGETRTFS